ncbi:MAG TPA: GPW/gp25 family protein [Bryobacteraceae bacterium]|nr:GPW/gp25 family protein [Bryobacteraceae bacterium]
MPTPFTSIKYPFAIDAGLGRLAEETDYAAHVDQLIRQLLFTSPGERINRPDFGCGLKRMVFAPNSDVAASLVQVSVYEALTKWLSTVIDVSAVQATADNEKLLVGIAYVLKARQERRYLNLEVTL